jgi:hypothetical protein
MTAWESIHFAHVPQREQIHRVESMSGEPGKKTAAAKDTEIRIKGYLAAEIKR